MTLDGTARKRRTLVVEDEVLVAMLLSDMLTDLGFDVEIAARLDDAVRAAETGAFDLAVLDVNLDGALSYAVVDVLRRRNIPVVLATGYGRSGLAPAYAGIVTIQKPFQRADLEAAISHALAAAS